MAEERPTDGEDGAGDGQRDHVVFNYIKSAFYRVVHVDGAIGGITPRGHIHCSIFSERLAIPRVVRHEVNADGTLVPEGQVAEAREGVSRELEVSLVLDERAAVELHQWLGRQIEKLHRFKAEGILK